jgi:hypothetical protein
MLIAVLATAMLYFDPVVNQPSNGYQTKANEDLAAELREESFVSPTERVAIGASNEEPSDSPETHLADGDIGFFHDADAASSVKLEPWANENVLSKVDHYYRHRFAQIDVNQLRRELVEIDRAIQSVGNIAGDNTLIVVNFFDDSAFEVNIESSNVMHSGSIFVSGTVFSGRYEDTPIWMHLTADGHFQVNLNTSESGYAVVPTPEIPNYLVYEFNAKETYESGKRIVD